MPRSKCNSSSRTNSGPWGPGLRVRCSQRPVTHTYSNGGLCLNQPDTMRPPHSTAPTPIPCLAMWPGALPKPPPTFRAPDDIDTDSEAEDDEPATANSSLPIQLSPAHVLLQAQQQQLLEQARASGNVKAQEVQQQYLQVEQDLHEQLAAVQQELQDKQVTNALANRILQPTS